MKLLIDAHVFDGKFQGTRTYLEGLYKKLIEHKDIDFHFAAKEIDNLKSIFGEDRNVHYIKLQSNNSIIRLGYEYPAIIRKYHIDYAHFQYISPLIKCCKEIVTVHDILFMDYPQYFPFIYKFKNSCLFYLSAKRADMLLTVSNYSKQRISSKFGINTDKIYITPNAVLPIDQDIRITNVIKELELDKYILSVGRIEPRKNYLLLLKAFVDLQLYKENYKLVLIGSPDLEYKDFFLYYNSLSKDIQQAIIIKGVSFPDLVTLYKSASLFVFPSLAEGFGIPPLEAIEYGCPLLCSNATAMAEFDLPDICSFDPNNINDLKDKMLYLLNNPIEWHDIRKRLHNQYNWYNTSEILYDLMKDNIRVNEKL